MRNNEILHQSLDNFEWNFKQIIEGFTDENFLILPKPHGNHLAWLLGHAIQSEKTIVEMVKPNSMPELPAGFTEKHSSKTANSENPDDFYTLAEYLNFADEIRCGTRGVIDDLTEEDLNRQIGEDENAFFKKGIHAMLFVSQHWFWHLGQIMTLRKILKLD